MSFIESIYLLSDCGIGCMSLVHDSRSWAQWRARLLNARSHFPVHLVTIESNSTIHCLQYSCSPVPILPFVMYGHFSANTEKKKRLIVVEGWSCLRSVYGPHMDFICGGQWQEFRASIRRFVNTFQQVCSVNFS